MNYIVPDLSSKKLKVKNISVEKLSKMDIFSAPFRSILSKEMELKQLEELEKSFYGGGFKFDRTRSYINLLDLIAPERSNNGCLTSWQGVFNSQLGHPDSLSEELLHITSCYIPSLAKDFLVELKGQSLRIQKIRKYLVSERIKTSSHVSEFWKDIKEQLGDKYRRKFVLRLDMFDSFMSVH